MADGCCGPQELEVVLTSEESKKKTLGELLGDQSMSADEAMAKVWKFLVENNCVREKEKKDESSGSC